MKRTALAGLLIAAAMLTSPVFASESLCDINLQKIKDTVVSTEVMSEDLKSDINELVAEAQTEKAKGTEEGEKNCTSLTSQALQKLQNNTKGGQ